MFVSGPGGECRELLSTNASSCSARGLGSVWGTSLVGLLLPSRSSQSPQTASSKRVKRAEAGLLGEHTVGGGERRPEAHCRRARARAGWVHRP